MKSVVEVWSQGIEHLTRVDPKICPIIEAYKDEVLSPSEDALTTLTNAIVGQQISVKAAAAIWGRLIGDCCFDDRPTRLDPQKILRVDIEGLRSLGLSYKKVEYARSLAGAFVTGPFNAYDFWSKSDQQIKADLIRLPGIGPWTAEMFLIFHLARPNVLPILDIGLLKAFAKVYGFEDLDRRQVTQVLLDYSKKHWEPYATLPVWYLWRYLDPGPVRY